MFKRICVALIISVCCASLAQAEGITFAYDLRGDDNLFSFPTNDPLNQTILDPGPITTWATYAMDFNSAGDTLYAVDHSGGTGVLLFGTVDKVTGAFTAGPSVLDPAGASLGVNETGLSIDPTDETFYLSTGTMLFDLDPVTGVASPIGTFSGTDGNGAAIGTMIDIAVDNNGNMYGFDIGTDSLWSIDKTSAAATHIVNSGFAANFAQGMDVDPTTNLLYSSVYTGGGTGSYGYWDTNTGAFTEVLDLPSFGSVELEIAIMVPEPSGIAILLISVISLAFLRRR